MVEKYLEMKKNVEEKKNSNIGIPCLEQSCTAHRPVEKYSVRIRVDVEVQLRLG